MRNKKIIVGHTTNDSEQIFVGCTKREALLSAYAQSLNDFNTWEYEKKYSHLLSEGIKCLYCGIDENTFYTTK